MQGFLFLGLSKGLYVPLTPALSLEGEGADRAEFGSVFLPLPGGMRGSIELSSALFFSLFLEGEGADRAEFSSVFLPLPGGRG